MAAHNVFFASALGRIIEGKGLDHAEIATKLGYRSGAFVRSWVNGTGMPPIHSLADVADAVGVPCEDLLLCWLVDHDLDHFERYEFIGALLMGELVVADLFAGEDEREAAPWWEMPREPMSIAECLTRLGDAPAQSYRSSA